MRHARRQVSHTNLSTLPPSQRLTQPLSTTRVSTGAPTVHDNIDHMWSWLCGVMGGDCSAVLLFEVGIYTGPLIDALLDVDRRGISVAFSQCIAFAVAGTVLMVGSAYMVRVQCRKCSLLLADGAAGSDRVGCN